MSSRPITCFSTSLAGPLFGSRFASCGKALSTRYGAPIPSPMVRNTAMIVNGLFVVTAQPAAAPMSGAVQGVDSTAVITPKITEPGTVSFFVSTE